MKSHRIARVSEVVRETAANAILFEIKDHVKGVTVTRRSLGRLAARQGVCLDHGDREGTEPGDARLKSAAGFVQTQVGGLTSRYVPHITFVLDEGVKKSIEIARLIREENERLAADARAGREGTTPPSIRRR